MPVPLDDLRTQECARRPSARQAHSERTFAWVLFLYETSALEPDDESFEFYAPEIGLIKDDEAELVDYGFDVFDLDGEGDEEDEEDEDGEED